MALSTGARKAPSALSLPVPLPWSGFSSVWLGRPPPRQQSPSCRALSSGSNGLDAAFPPYPSLGYNCTRSRDVPRPPSSRSASSRRSSSSAAGEPNPFQSFLGGFSNKLSQPAGRASQGPNNLFTQSSKRKQEDAAMSVHHLHVLSTKHNTHITLSKPDRGAIISVTTGHLGFRKSARGTYDAAYQLAASVMNRIQNDGLLVEIQRLELVFRGFGPGRTAVTKALLGLEGRRLRDRVVRVMDATKLKIGGTRSPKPRRLG